MMLSQVEREASSPAFSVAQENEAQPIYPASLSGNTQARRKTIATLVTGLWLSCLAALGFWLFHQSDYFHHQGRYPDGWVGYTKRTFMGLVIFVACGGAGIALALRGTITLALLLPKRNERLLLSGVGLAFMSVGTAGLFWGHESMKCLVVFCINTDKHPEIPFERPEAGLGFLSVIGMSAFFTLLPAGLVLVAGAFPLRWHVCISRRSILPVSIALLLLVMFSVVTFYVPNSWEFFVAARIANNAQLRVSTNASECSNFRKTTCPEVPWAFMKTRAIHVSSSLTLKLYPSNMLFFTYLGLFCVLSFVLTSTRGLRLFCASGLFPGVALTNGQFVFGALTATMLSLFFFYWHHDHNYNGYWNGGSERGVSETERWARSLGQLAVAFLSLLMFPASRFSLLHACLGTSWESSIWAHRVLGYGMLGATVGHMGAWYLFFHENGNFPHDVFAIPPRTQISRDNFTVPLISLTTWFLIISTGFFALWPLRRRAFAVFHTFHVLGFVITVPAVLWHAAAAWEYMLPGLTVYGLDIIFRLRCSSRCLNVIGIRFHDDVIQIDFQLLRAERTQVPPGSFLFLSVPEISILEWHPFTLCAAESPEFGFSIYIKANASPNSWTSMLVRLCRQSVADPPLMLSQGTTGGTAFTLDDYDHIIFVAGGIGVTPCYAIAQSLCTSDNVNFSPKHVSFLWCTRDVALLLHFRDLLVRVRERQRNTTVRLFCSRQDHRTLAEHSLQETIPIEQGRPNVHAEVSQFMGLEPSSQEDKRTLVFTCGPGELVEAARRTAQAHDCCFHAETFLL